MVKLAVFDLDGTLIDSLPVTFEAINDAIEPLTRRRLAPDEISAHFGGAEASVIAKIVGAENAEACYHRMVASLARRLTEVEPFDGIIEMLDQLKNSGTSLAIFTGRSRRTTDLVLRHLGLAGRFAQVVAGDEVAHKPHPEGIYRICEKTRVKVHELAMVGDHPYDITAAKTAGAALTVACTWGVATREALRATAPTHIAESPSELFGLLRPNAPTAR